MKNYAYTIFLTILSHLKPLQFIPSLNITQRKEKRAKRKFQYAKLNNEMSTSKKRPFGYAKKRRGGMDRNKGNTMWFCFIFLTPHSGWICRLRLW
jgi:hypothetical protein